MGIRDIVQPGKHIQVEMRAYPRRITQFAIDQRIGGRIMRIGEIHRHFADIHKRGIQVQAHPGFKVDTGVEQVFRCAFHLLAAEIDQRFGVGRVLLFGVDRYGLEIDVFEIAIGIADQEEASPPKENLSQTFGYTTG